jgi:hypothetical protein
MALTIVRQPVSVLVNEGSSSVTFTVSAIDPSLPAGEVKYLWRTQDSVIPAGYNPLGGTSGSFNTGNTQLTLSPASAFDNDTFVALISGVTTTNNAYLSSNIITFGIRLSGDVYSGFETLTEVGSNRVRRLHNLGYL